MTDTSPGQHPTTPGTRDEDDELEEDGVGESNSQDEEGTEEGNELGEEEGEELGDEAEDEEGEDEDDVLDDDGGEPLVVIDSPFLRPRPRAQH